MNLVEFAREIGTDADAQAVEDWLADLSASVADPLVQEKGSAFCRNLENEAVLPSFSEGRVALTKLVLAVAAWCAEDSSTRGVAVDRAREWLNRDAGTYLCRRSRYRPCPTVDCGE